MIYQSLLSSLLASCTACWLVLKIKIIEGGESHPQRAVLITWERRIKRILKMIRMSTSSFKNRDGLKFPSVALEGLFIDLYKETASKKIHSQLPGSWKQRQGQLPSSVEQLVINKEAGPPSVVLHLFFDISGTGCP